MYTKASLMALCAAATVNGVVGAAHGHRHMHADKRDVAWASTETVVVTDYYTVTVTDGQTVAAATATPAATVAAIPNDAAPAPAKNAQSSSAIPKPESVTSAAVKSSSPAAKPPASTPTTLITNVKPNVKSTTSSSSTTVPAENTPIQILALTTPAAETTSSSSSAVPTTSSTSSVVEVPTVVASSTTSATAKASPPPHTQAAPKVNNANTSGTGSKRGLAFNDASLVQEFFNLGGRASWAYNWGPSSAPLPAGVTYYPMLWSPAPEHSNGWDGFAKTAIANGADALLGFNEPDIASQANMSPQAAAAAHIQMMNPYAGQARISAPAISSSENANQGVDWLRQFFSACGGQCHVDFCVAHWYGPGGQNGAQLFLSHLKDVSAACDNKPIWVTEFAAQSDNIDSFMSDVLVALDSSEYGFVEKYSYFMAGVGQLFSSPTSFSSFGNTYAGI